MTQKQAQTIEQALARATKEGIRIIGEGHLKTGERFWIVSAKGYEQNNRAYIVRLTDEPRPQLQCNCRASGICKHRAVTHAALLAEVEARIVRAPERKEAAQSISYGECKSCAGTYAIVSDEPSTQQDLCDGCLDEHGYFEQQAEAERLAALPRELANVETSEESKLEVVEEQLEAKRIEREVKRIETPHWSVQLHRDLDAQAERSRKREAAILETTGDFSIYRS